MLFRIMGLNRFFENFLLPISPLHVKQIARVDNYYLTLKWVMGGLELELMPVIQKIYDAFNKARETKIPNP